VLDDVEEVSINLFCDGVLVGYYGGADSGWRYASPWLDAVWPLPTHWRPLPNKPAAGGGAS
jgi:hypothetical protein